VSKVQVRSQVAYKNQVARLEVVGEDGVLVLLLELADRGKARLEDVVVNGIEVFFVHLKLASAGGDEVSGVEWFSELVRLGMRNVARVMSKGRRGLTLCAM